MIKQKKYIFLFFFLISCSYHQLYSQSIFAKTPSAALNSLSLYHHFPFSQQKSYDKSSVLKSSQATAPRGPVAPKAYNYDHLAFFCKLEVKMEKSARLPIKMRLGDVDYVDWLEGKRERY